MAIASLDESTTKEVLRQVEFYFSDSNLPRDKFLSQSVQESEDGLVSLALICSFAKMRKYLKLGETKADDVSEDTVAAVADVLKNSNSLKLSEDGKKVGRSTELSEKVAEQVDCRTVAMSPLPYNVQVEDLEGFFGKHGKVNSVRLPRVIGDKKQFCGTALVEFSDEEDAKKVLTTSLVYAGAELEMKPKKDFDAERHQQWKKEGEKNHSDKDGSHSSYPKGLVIAFKLTSIKPNENEAMKQNGDEVAEKVPDTDNGEKKSTEDVVVEKVSDTDNSEKKPTEDVVVEKVSDTDNGEKKSTECVVAEKVPDNDNSEKEPAEDVEMANGEETSNDAKEKVCVEESKEEKNGSSRDENIVTREDVKAVLGKFGAVKYVDFRMGDESGYVRFDDRDAGIRARAVAALDDNGGFILKGYIMALEPLSDDAEKDYWSQLRDKQQDKRKDFRGNHRGGRGGGRGYRGGGRGFNGNKRQRRD